MRTPEEIARACFLMQDLLTSKPPPGKESLRMLGALALQVLEWTNGVNGGFAEMLTGLESLQPLQKAVERSEKN